MSSSHFRLLGSSVVPLATGLVLAAWFVLPALTELGWVLTGHGLFAGLILSHLFPWRELVDFKIFCPHNYPTLRPSLPLWYFPAVLKCFPNGTKIFFPTSVGLRSP